MRLGVKHANQQTVVRADFSGGLNTAASIESIAENQLFECINMDVDHSTGRLKTVSGTEEMVTQAGIFAAVYDTINDKLLLVLEDKSVHIAEMDGSVGESLGTLTGDLYPSYCAWETGVLIASGGKLQYYNGSELVTIDTSPTSNSVYIRASRVLVTDAENIYYSAVGDETDWSDSTGDDSSSKWIEAGYKDGGKFIGMASLSSDVIIIKDNRRVYRLSGEYPDWTMAEISRNVECAGRRSYCSVADAVFVLGKNEVQVIQPTDNYGDMQPANVGTLVTSELQRLPEDAIVRYIPPLSQVWFIGSGGEVLLYDLTTKSWYKRRFNSPVVDAFSVGDRVYVIKEASVSKLNDAVFYDDGLPLVWRFRAQRLLSQNEYLLKRTQISVVPRTTELYSGYISVGAVKVDLPVPTRNIRIKDNRALIWNNQAKISPSGRRKGVYASGELIRDDREIIRDNNRRIFEQRTVTRETRNVFRSKFLDVKGEGRMGGFVLVGIILSIAEV